MAAQYLGHSLPPCNRYNYRHMHIPSGLSALNTISSYAIGIVASTVVGIFTIPVLVSTLGAQQWGILALIQTLGLLFGIVVAFGWGVTGPSQVADTAPVERPKIYHDSLIARLLLAALATPLMAAVILLISDASWLTAFLGAGAYLTPLLGATWYFIGEAKPWILFFIDTVPQLLGTVFGMILAAISHLLWAFLLTQFLFNVTSIILEVFHILHNKHHIQKVTLPRITHVIKEQYPAVTAALTSGLYVNLPLVCVQIFLPQLTPVYAMADKFYKYASAAFSPIQQFLQGWIPRALNAQRIHRMRFGILIALGFGLIGGAAIAFLTKPIGAILSQNKVLVPLSVSIALGIAFCAVSCSAVIGYACLVLMKQVRAVAVSNLIGALIGSPLIILAGMAHNLTLIACSVALSELCVMAYQYRVFRRSSGAKTPE